MQLEANTLNSWTDNLYVQSTRTCLPPPCSPCPKSKKAGVITLCGNFLKENEEAAYLGITLTKGKTRKTHITKAEAKDRRNLTIVCALANTTTEASDNITKTVYKATVRPHFEYGSTVWSTEA